MLDSIRIIAEQWSNGAMEQWSNGAMEQWSNVYYLPAAQLLYAVI